ncbi:MAG: transporter substrate-binding domain-containing protein [Desulfobacterales bacterium]|nr:transporter substrate-binding domain-containing protein [Desulfobacterales bacterium]
MKKIYTGIVLGIFLLLSGPSYGETIVFATGEWPPFIGETLDDYGLHSRILKKVFVKMGHEVKFEFMPWKRVYELTKKGDYIATYTWSKTPEREGEMFYPANELSLSKEVGFYKKSKFPNGLAVSSLDDIKTQNLKVVGIASYWYEKALKEMGIKVHIVSTGELAWKMLNGGRADILIENIDVGKAESQTALGAGKDAGFGMTEPVKTQQMYLIFSRVHPRSKEIMAEYDETVSKMKAAGEL